MNALTRPKPSVSALAEAEEQYARERRENSTATASEIESDLLYLTALGAAVHRVALMVCSASHLVGYRAVPSADIPRTIARLAESFDEQFAPEAWRVVQAAALEAVGS